MMLLAKDRLRRRFAVDTVGLRDGSARNTCSDGRRMARE